MKKCRLTTLGSSVAGACLATLLGSTNAFALPIPISCPSFGSLPAATFNPSGAASGIPNTSVCQSTFVVGNDTITIGLEAHARYSNDVVTDDGAGTYFADPGANFGDPLNPGGPGPGTALGSTWNFAFYASISGGGTLANYDISFLYDMDPAVANDRANFGSLNLNAFNAAFGVNATSYQDSQNLNFAFMCTSIPGAVVAPAAGCPFNPLATGVYSGAIDVRNLAGALLGEVSAQVNVGADAVPEPASMVLLGSGLLGLAARRRVKRAKA